MVPNSNFWAGRNVLLTGHTGFKGAWLSLWLKRLGANVTGISLDPAESPNLYSQLGDGNCAVDKRGDLRDLSALRSFVRGAAPDVVFHLAAQAIVRTSYQQPVDTFSTNVMGTAHLLDALRDTPSVRVIVVATTDKVYRNCELRHPYSEDDALGGHDPYSASKAACEMVISSYRSSFLASQGVAVASVRSGNVIGGGDWAQDRLIPDAMRAWTKNQALVIRYPSAVRPWQHVLDPLFGYLKLAERLFEEPKLAGAFNFGPTTQSEVSVKTVVELAKQSFGRGEVHYGDPSGEPHEASMLMLDTSKTLRILGVQSLWSISEGIDRTVGWYRAFYQGHSAIELCTADIAEFECNR